MKKERNPRRENRSIQAGLGNPAGSVPDHRNKAGVAVKGVVVFLLGKGLAFNVYRTQHW